MAVKVKKFRVRAGDIVYVPGDIIQGLDKAEEKRLIEDGYCESVFQITEPNEEESVDPKEPDKENSKDQTQEKDGPVTEHPLTAGKGKKK